MEYFFLIVLIILAVLYKSYQPKHDKYSLVRKYLVQDANISQGKPILWIYVPTVPNSRKIKYGDGPNTNINQDYLYLTLKSIINNNPSFTICVIDNNSFRKIIPGWEYDLNAIPPPLSTNMLHLALAKVLYIYGGMVVPLSFLCFKDLTPMYEHSKNGAFICENVNRSFGVREFTPDPTFMGCLPNDPTIFEYSKFCETIISDTSEEPAFLGVHSNWFYEKKVTIISGEQIGIRVGKRPITIEDLMGTEPLPLNDAYGIYIPDKEILKRTNYEWFACLSKREILSGNTILQKYILLTSSDTWTSFWKS